MIISNESFYVSFDLRIIYSLKNECVGRSNGVWIYRTRARTAASGITAEGRPYAVTKAAAGSSDQWGAELALRGAVEGAGQVGMTTGQSRVKHQLSSTFSE